MPSYLITAPDGRKYRVSGQGTADEALAHFQQQYAGQGRSDPSSGGITPEQIQAAYDRSPEATPSSVGDVAMQAGKNLIPSAKRFGSDIAGMIAHPIETVQNIGRLGLGVAEKAIPGQQPHEVYADTLGRYFADRYGGVDNIKRTIAQDPVGFAADVATVLSGGELAAARAAPTIARVAGTAARAVDPINATVRVATGAAKAVGKGAGTLASSALGVSTGAGGEAIRTAAKAGFQGGEAARTFRQNMRGSVPIEDVVAQAKNGIDAIRQERQAAYRSGMADLSKDQTVLDFRKIDAALHSTPPVKSFKGVSLQPSAADTTQEIATVLDQWRKLPAKDFHTAEGFDALKQRLGDIVANAKPGSPSQKIATQVYNIVKDQIVRQAPRYARTMENYQKASELIREIEGTLSINPRARIDTSLRKLQSVMRNNVSTNYGKRADLVKLLEEKGATHILSALAGQALNTWEPRGLARVTAGGVGGVVAAMNPSVAVPIAGALTTSSPRLAGETAHALGRFARTLADIPSPLTAGGTLRTGYYGNRSLADLGK